MEITIEGNLAELGILSDTILTEGNISHNPVDLLIQDANVINVRAAYNPEMLLDASLAMPTSYSITSELKLYASSIQFLAKEVKDNETESDCIIGDNNQLQDNDAETDKHEISW